MACAGANCICGCCEGIGLRTPVRAIQPPDRRSIAHRAGRRSDHLSSILSALSADPRARGLATRETSDVSIAVADAAASLLDVIGFQTERIADEHYLLAAREQRSVGWLAELVGYRPLPGVAASVDLAFTLTEAPGAPTAALPSVPIPAGTPAQSVPDPGQEPQTFETAVDIEARVEWNAIPVRTNLPWAPRSGDRFCWLEGLATGLEPGHAILIVGAERDDPALPWSVRILTGVRPEPESNRTRVEWAVALGPQWNAVAQAVELFAFRRRAALFGAAAPDARLLQDSGLPQDPAGAWAGYAIDPERLDLDQEIPAVVADSWVALKGPVHTNLYAVSAASSVGRADFGLSAKVTRIVPTSTENLTAERYPLNATSVFCASEPLVASGRPLPSCISGTDLDLAIPLDGMKAGQRLAVTGRQARVTVLAPGIALQPDEGPAIAIAPRSAALAIGAPERMVGGKFELIPPDDLSGAPLARFRLRLDDGREGFATFVAGQYALAPPRDDDPEVAVVVEIARVAGLLELADPLLLLLDRASVRVNANIAPATAGETVAETLGSSTGKADQSFVLKQSPLTWIPSAAQGGRTSTLALRVNGVLWREVPTLAGAGPAERVYATRVDDRGRTHILLGDGVEGAIPPAGTENIRATYRRTLGAGGNVRVGAITTLMARPAGVSGVNNPAAAAGGQDGEPLDSARDNAPLRTKTLGRAVSVEDYAGLARGFAGIAKARADWIPVGLGRGVLLTVAADAGATVDPAGDLASGLLAELRSYGDPWLPLRIVSYRPRRFKLAAALTLAPEADAPALLAELTAMLADAFSFQARAFGQGVSADEVAALLHRASPYVLAVGLTALHLGASVAVRPRLFARLPVASLAAVPQGAELLILDGTPRLEAVA